MSYILDALRKAERERHLGQPPSLTVPASPEPPARPRLWLWLGAGLGLGLNAALLVFFLTRPPPSSPPVITAATVPAPAPTVAAALPAPSSPPEPRSLPPAGETAGGVEPPAAARESTQPATAATTAKAAAPPAPRRQEAVGKSARSESSRPTLAPASRERREATTPPSLTPGSVTLAPEPEPIPPLETLPASARRGIPALNLDIHIHSNDPDKRFVVINGRRYREGDRLGDGPVLETVTPDGAILRQGGQRFRLSVRR